jgi:hypothetical protein
VLRSRAELEDANRIIGPTAVSPDAEETCVTTAIAERLAPFITDTTHYLNQAAAWQTILLEARGPRC